ncbi:hypothetical protein [Maricaulis sp.]|uniref:hypothetical protein n=1 Tax=Maricaulis sp. TaxID=1486257 RepID=UPI002622ADC6|nr:hypothetical protein [Maricaulis sp.]
MAAIASASPVWAQSDLPTPTTHDYVACSDDPDESVCLLELATRGSIRALTQDADLARHPDIIADIHERRGTVPELAPDPAAEALGEPLRLEYAAIDAAQQLIDSGADPETALEPVRQTARGRSSQSLMLGQVHLNSGAEIRASAFRALAMRHSHYDEDAAYTRPSRPLALAALAGWENELRHSRDISPLHNPDLSPTSLFHRYTQLGEEDGARRMFRIANGPRLDLSDEMAIEFALGRPLAALEIFNASGARGLERLDAMIRLRQRAIRSGNTALKQWALEVSIDDCETLPALSLEAFDALGPAGDDTTLRALALCYTHQAQDHHRDSTRFVASALDMLDRLGAVAEADALMNRWQGYAQREANGEACPGQTGYPAGRNGRAAIPARCAITVYQAMLAQRDRQVEAFDVGHYQVSTALRYDLAAGRGLRNLERYTPFARSQGEIDIALSSCVSDYTRPRTLDLDLAETCARRLIAVSGNRALSAHEDYLVSIDPLDPPRRQSGPFRAAEAALHLAGAAARHGRTDLAEEMLQIALSIWRQQPAAHQPLGAGISIKTTILARLGAAED